MNWEIKVPTPEDAPDIVGLIRIGIEERAFHDRVISLEDALEYAFSSPPKGYNLFICLIENEIAGYIDGLVGKRGVGIVTGICVRPEHRRKGVGEQLMGRILDQFRLGECHKARTEVFADNQGAIRFYLRCDFIQEGYLKKDEGKRDVIIMGRFLEVLEENTP
ncbi:MAG: GNAT family N-acetyltransferase [Promethearchaeota archaeon]